MIAPLIKARVRLSRRNAAQVLLNGGALPRIKYGELVRDSKPESARPLKNHCRWQAQFPGEKVDADLGENHRLQDLLGPNDEAQQPAGREGR